ncbi:MAG: transglutaminase domain-containing protein [Bdellovibrionales bacterium]|nr:transglutaminase domain-containing protein [Bdellovibrionales bacterium]
MQKKTVILIGGILLISFVGALQFLPKPQSPPSPVSRTVSYGFEVKNNTNKLLKDIEVDVFAPLLTTPFQKRVSISSTPESIPQNGTLTFTLTIPPYGTKLLTIESNLELFPRAYSNAPPSSGMFLGSEPFIDLENKEIEALHPSLQRKNSLETALAIYSWVKDNISHSGYLKQAKGSTYALRERNGDCTEYAALLVALARKSNIPTKAVSGFFVTKDRFLRPIEFHTWTELFFDNTWHLFDAHKAIALADSEKFIAFGSVKDKEHASSGISPLRFSSSAPGVTIRMR